MQIRKAGAGDVEGCKRINIAVWGDEWKDPGYFEERVKNGELFVAADKNIVIGYIAFRKKYWNRNYYIEEMAIDPKHQRKGIASALVRRLEELCSKDNVRLFSSTESDNLKSIRFHERNGFTKAGSVENMFVEGRKEIIFSKKKW